MPPRRLCRRADGQPDAEMDGRRHARVRRVGGRGRHGCPSSPDGQCHGGTGEVPGGGDGDTCKAVKVRNSRELARGATRAAVFPPTGDDPKPLPKPSMRRFRRLQGFRWRCHEFVNSIIDGTRGSDIAVAAVDDASRVVMRLPCGGDACLNGGVESGGRIQAVRLRGHREDRPQSTLVGTPVNDQRAADEFARVRQ